MTTLEVRQAAGRAAAELRRRGWIQHALFSSPDATTCRVCLLGAVLFATDGVIPTRTGISTIWPPLAYDLESAIFAQIPDASGVGRWNDEPGRTVDEVLAVLDQIAAA